MADAAPALRIIAGDVDKEGKLLRGAGFKSSRAADGKYHVIFTDPFNSIYSAVATQVAFDNLKNQPTDGALVGKIENGSIYVLTGDSQQADRGFSFIAVGV